MQFELDFTPKTKTGKAKRPPATYPLDSKGHLRFLVETKEYMIYLYGQNQHLCFIRDHSSADDGTNYPIMRKDAEEIMGKKYYHHCNHVSHEGGKAKVYVRRAK